MHAESSDGSLLLDAPAIEARAEEARGKMPEHYSRQKVQLGILRPKTNMEKRSEQNGFLLQPRKNWCLWKPHASEDARANAFQESRAG